MLLEPVNLSGESENWGILRCKCLIFSERVDAGAKFFC